MRRPSLPSLTRETTSDDRQLGGPADDAPGEGLASVGRRGFVRRLTAAVRAEWREVGILGRVAFLGVVISFAVAVALGFWIPEIATQHILSARAELIAAISTQMASEDLFPVGSPGSRSYDAFDEAVQRRVVGGETVRVKLWSLDGRILYSDDPGLVGRDFGLSEPATAALEGETQFNISDLSDPAHAGERDLVELIEFYVPVRTQTGEILGLFEVEQSVDELENTRGHIQRNVWGAILSGIGLLSVFMAALTLASARIMNRRRREAERLLGSLFRAQEEERKRTVGALHDDVGQPLYRLLYGLEGTRTKLDPDDPAAQELRHLEGIVRDVDRTLRAELRLLHRGVKDDLGFEAAIEDLVDITERETDLSIESAIEPDAADRLSDVARVALVHAAGEGLMNVRKHAEAEQVRVEVRARPDRVVLEITDDGKGIGRHEGLGLVTLRERLEAIGGGLIVTGLRRGGTRVSAWVPRRMGDR